MFWCNRVARKLFVLLLGELCVGTISWQTTVYSVLGYSAGYEIQSVSIAFVFGLCTGMVAPNLWCQDSRMCVVHIIWHWWWRWEGLLCLWLARFTSLKNSWRLYEYRVGHVKMFIDCIAPYPLNLGLITLIFDWCEGNWTAVYPYVLMQVKRQWQVHRDGCDNGCGCDTMC